MTVTVRYMAQVKLAAGTTSERVELDAGCTAQELVARLAHQRGGTLRHLLLDAAGRLQPTILLFVGDEQVREEPPVVLKDGDVLMVLSPVAGG